MAPTSLPPPPVVAPAGRVKSQPNGQTCTVAQGSGAMPGAAVDAVQVGCATAVWGLPEGAWLRETCSNAPPGQGVRTMWRLTRQDETQLTVNNGTMAYANAQCSGAGTVQTDKEYARFVVDRKANPTRAVFARSGPYLCWGVDHFWPQFPTMDAVKRIVVGDPAQSGQCYVLPN